MTDNPAAPPIARRRTLAVVLASLASYRSTARLAHGADRLAALTHGYQAAFLLGGIFAALAALTGGALLRSPAPAAAIV
jgi:hypothetical protein